MKRGYREQAPRAGIAFRSVNRQGTAHYDPELQRHHILPRQLLSVNCFGAMFTVIGRGRIGFDDFRQNGLLLPANENAARRTALPLHRGPHRDYNAMVIDRVGSIERTWSCQRMRDTEGAAIDALARLALLQKALRRRLLDTARPMRLNTRDPLGTGFNFSDLDAMAEMLWNTAV